MSLCCCTDPVSRFLYGSLLPLPDREFEDSQIAECGFVFDKAVPDPDRPRKVEVLDLFKVETRAVPFTLGSINLTARVRVITSLFPSEELFRYGYVGGALRNLDMLSGHLYALMRAIVDGDRARKVEITALSLYEFRLDGGGERWTPPTYDSLGAACRLALGRDFNVVELSSMGAVFLSGARADELPPTIVLNRAMTSVLKAARSTQGCFVRRVLMCLAGCTGWDGDPESRLMEIAPSLRGRQLVVFTTPDDHYFSGESGFSPVFAATLRAAGVVVSEVAITPHQVDVHKRASHGRTSDMFWSRTEVATDQFEMRPLENFYAAVVRQFLNRGGAGEAKTVT